MGGRTWGMVEVSESMRRGGGLAAKRMCGGHGWRSRVGHLKCCK
jgi:hypothetical protein